MWHASSSTRRSFTHAKTSHCRWKVTLLKHIMLLLKASAPWLLLAFLGQLVSLSCGARKSDRAVSKVGVAGGRGKFSTKERMQCTWVASEVRDAVQLLVKCENPEARVTGGIADLRCEYNAKPRGCPGYLSEPLNFWKQVARALKRLQGKVCKDERALVRAGMCKRAPRSAHFKLDISSSRVSAQSGDPGTQPPSPPPSSHSTSTATTACMRRRADHGKTAEEYCGSSWASVCSFFLSMMQSEEDC
ncbi:fibroblast growth factor-binding protein 1 [Pundamilia nyererei]|uniref:Fibroblast growth factor-binding protein 1 n=1 Tax=Pundamilia nyererei TaxID=303518 RepID=A0A9Y3QXN7_9CICH|nr:PREDICTED: fibroblast growth factor-binding protein 1 [Pundamilia nyererei]